MFLAPINIIIQKVGTLDDQLVMRVSEDDDLYHCTYTQNSINSITNFELTMDNLLEYLVLFCEGIAKDSDGPDYIQFDIPSFPSVSMSVADVNYHITPILRQIEFLHKMEDWPLENNPSLGPASISSPKN